MNNAYYRSTFFWAALAIFCLVANVGCGLLSPNKEAVIEKLVKEVSANRSTVVTPGSDFADFRAYRQDGTDEVVFEYTFKQGKESALVGVDPAEFKKRLAEGLQTGELAAVFKMGIKFTYSYIDSNGKEVIRETLSQDDLDSQ